MNKLKVSVISLLMATCLSAPSYAESFAPLANTEFDSEHSYSAAAAAAASGQWIQASDGRWWYKHTDGSYTTNNWEYINGEWYHFDSQGWMQTGTLVLSGITYKLNSSGALYYTQLPVTRRKQEQSSWCWAASSEMVGKYINSSSSRSQTDIVTFVKGSAINAGGTDSEIERAIEYVCSRNAVVSTSPLSQTNAWNEIMNGDPFVAHVTWNGGGGHAITCYAFDRDNYNGLTYFHDPWESTASYSLTYSILLTGCNLPTGSGKCTSAIWLN